MSIDLKGLSPKQLQDLIAKAEQQKQKLHKERKEVVRKKIIDLARDEGYAIDDLFGSRRRKSAMAGRKVPAKYRNPANPSQTWSGRGKRPRWFVEAINKGKKEKDLLI